MSAAASTSENGDSVENQTCINRSRDTSVATPEQLQGAPTSPSRTFGSALPGVLLRQPIEVVPARNLSVIEPKLEGGIIPLHIDDTSAFRLTKNFESHAGTRHIDIRHHYIRSSTQSRHSALQPQRSRQSTHAFTTAIHSHSIPRRYSFVVLGSAHSPVTGRDRRLRFHVGMQAPSTTQ
jgi:hypothetical protein